MSSKEEESSSKFITTLLDSAAKLNVEGDERKGLEVLENAVEIVLKDVSTYKLSGILDTGRI